MSQTRAQRIRDLFDVVVDLPHADREAHLKLACSGDECLRSEVLSLLSSLEHGPAALDIDPTTWFQHVSDGLAADPTQNAASEALDAVHSARAGHVANTQLAGLIVGDFRIVRLIGRGGMSAVYEAEQISLARRVALKVLQVWSAGPAAHRRFVAEATVLARLKHPGIAQVIAAGTQSIELDDRRHQLAESLLSGVRSLPWIAIELVEDARTIVEHCRDATAEAVLSLFAVIADAVQFGHQQGFIHRDLKPANILINARGEPKVIDFGIARAVGTAGDSAQTVDGAMIGSPRYMSPEQCDPSFGSIDTRTDVYALGVVLFESLTGTAPHAGTHDSVAAVLHAITAKQVPNPRSINPKLSSDAAIVVLKALERVQDDRYQSMAEFAADMRRVLSREPISARKRSLAYVGKMFVRRRPVRTALMVAALLSAMAGVVGISFGLARERDARREADHIAWLANLAAADSSIRLGDGGTAMRRLEGIPPAKRDWEWNYLHAQADTSIEMWDIDGEPNYTGASRSGRWIVVCDPTRSNVRVLDASTHALAFTLADCVSVGNIEWSPDESLVAVPTLHSVVVVDQKSGQVVIECRIPGSEAPAGCAFNQDKSLLAVGLTNAGGLAVFSMHTGLQVFTLPGEGWTYRPDFTPDGRVLTWCMGRTLFALDSTTWKIIGSMPVRRVTNVEPGGVAVSPDGRTIAVICGTSVQLVDLPSLTVRVELRGHAQRVHSVVFDCDGKHVLTASFDRTVRLWNADTGDLDATLLGNERPVRCAVFSCHDEQSGRAVMSLDMGNRVRCWRLASNGPVFRGEVPPSGSLIGQLVWSSNSDVLTAAAEGSLGSMTLRPTFKPLQNSYDSSSSTYHAVLPNQRHLARNVEDRALELVSLDTRDVEWRVPADRIIGLGVSADGRFIAGFERSGAASVFLASDGTRVAQVPGDPTGNNFARLSPDGSRLVVTELTGPLRIYDTRSSTLIRELAPAQSHGMGAAFSANGSLLAYSDTLESVTVADARTLTPLLHIDRIGGTVWSVAFSPDGRRLAVGAQDRITHIFDLPRGDEVLQLRDHTGTITALAWSPDGRYLATGGWDKKIFVYDGDPQSRHP